ncbi:DUF1709-domain-containing protein [Aspergillus campestris IBT 28561]|uniref:DUF1709-domain-containing protein n=1 Tax=Aspergillus campestris (strain IBT 28561) TaxID=1392248 RepID=A0A2I1CYQ5_ASPC2|nr:DUF1709-domain-containing protein [Aspergillus campestris IBT 28561]PKY02769.1 DUF1709-domain-containing protein [Aspergillus campestris IBT 28561]
MGSGLGQRPLSEVSPMAQRRNSPIWNQSNKAIKHEPSPHDAPASPRLFWKGRESGSPFQKSSENQAPYDPDSTFSPSRRASLENLKRQSRVRNSNMLRDYKQEYDPATVYVPQRPLAPRRSPERQSQTGASLENPNTQDDTLVGPRPPSPSKDQSAPAKSSLSRASRFGAKDWGFDPESEIWSDLDRHPKSVTFDAAPPQVNEYVMTTPDPSSVASDSRDGSYDTEDDEGDMSFDRDSSFDRDDSFDASLEDLEKTPVVLPEDWRYMSPSNANEALVKEEEDPFTEDEENHSPNPRPSAAQGLSRRHSRVESLDSNGERRPLPPLPNGTPQPATQRPTSPGKLTAAFERGTGAQRVLPSPPAAASYTKSDITGRNHASMPLEERLRLMMIQEKERASVDSDRTRTEEPHPRPMEDEESGDVETPKEKSQEESLAIKGPQDHTEGFSAPHISRDSILRDLRKSESYMDDSYEDSSQPGSSPRPMAYDPDYPIPSLEHDDMYDDDDDTDDDTGSVVIKHEEHDDDLYDVPEYDGIMPPKDLSFKSLPDRSDDQSHYSSHSLAADAEKHAESPPDEGQTTPIPADQAKQELTHNISEKTQQESQAHKQSPPQMEPLRTSLQRPATPEIDSPVSAPSSPDSVIRHSVEDDISDSEISVDDDVPPPIATVKAHGAGLKTRPSLTPLDLQTMAATRRQVSGQGPPPVPSLHKQLSNEQEPEQASEDSQPEDPSPPQLGVDVAQRQSSLMKLDIPFSIQEESLGFGLDKEFDRVIETQKKGYLTRHNTKVVIASSSNDDGVPQTPGQAPTDARNPRSAGPAQRKPSQQTWTTVPWNSGPRRSSIRTTSGAIRKKPVSGPAPPLPCQQSNVQDAPATIEETEPALSGVLEEGEERGRLFVKVVGMKSLDLPLPRGERSHFSLTLDNGIHCVTTAWLELGKSAPIGQEFELIVHNDLEFQLTLQMKADEDKFRTEESAPAATPARQKASTFSRVFASPRKRKEMEMKQQLASQQQQKSKDPNAAVWDKLRTLIARDGSFGRAYVSLSDHEKHAFGRPYTVDVACFNEWAVEEQPSSVKSKKSTTSAASQRRPPYKIGKLELQLLFVPKPKNSKDEDMPKSMNACIREMREAETASARTWEGFLSQQGGDCPYWRRRFFKLQGSKLIAYHETSRQPRANINLSKAAKLIDDRSALTKRETSTRGGGRRRSAFAEEEEGYMFVEEGFRIRFGNGEVIDFYADSAADKDGWMGVLADTVGKGSTSSSQAKPWTELVLKRERSMKSSRRETLDRTSGKSMGAPPPPIPKKDAPAPPATATGPPPSAMASHRPSRPQHRHTQSQPDARGADARKNKARSLMF